VAEIERVAQILVFLKKKELRATVKGAFEVAISL